MLNVIFLEKHFKKFKIVGISGYRPTSESTVCQNSASPDGGWEGHEEWVQNSDGENLWIISTYKINKEFIE